MPAKGHIKDTPQRHGVRPMSNQSAQKGIHRRAYTMPGFHTAAVNYVIKNVFASTARYS